MIPSPLRGEGKGEGKMFKKKQKQFKELSENDVQSRLYGFGEKQVPTPSPPEASGGEGRGEGEPPKKESPDKQPNDPAIAKAKPCHSRESGNPAMSNKTWLIPAVIIILILAAWLSRKPTETPAPITKPKPPAPTIKYTDRETDAIKPYTIQVAVYENEVDSKRLIEKLAQEGLKAYVSPTKSRTGKIRYRIYVEEFASLAEGKSLLTKLKGQPGLKDSFLRKK